MKLLWPFGVLLAVAIIGIAGWLVYGNMPAPSRTLELTPAPASAP